MTSDEGFQGLSTAVHDMFARSEQDLQHLGNSGKGRGPSQQDLAFALTLLLVELAASDHNFDQDEYAIIVNGIQRTFGMTPAHVTNLIQQAQQRLSQFRGTDEVATLLRENTPLIERVKMLEVIDQVIQADGITDGFEIYHRHRLVSLLGLQEHLKAQREGEEP